MTYTKNQIKSHLQAARKLDAVMTEVFDYLKMNRSCSEYEVQQFILARFNHHRLKTDRERTPIVAFAKSTADVHHYPRENSSRRIKPGSLIMIDIWARLDKKSSIFSDITWMAFWGEKIPREILKNFILVVKARDGALSYIKSCLKKGELPRAKAADLAARNIICAHGHGRRFVHTTGHSLGLSQPHGAFKGLRGDNPETLKTEVPYTIEPGVYFKKKFGIRSEMNFYLTRDLKLRITSKLQKSLILL